MTLILQVERLYALIICRYRSFIVPPLTASSCPSSSPRTKCLLESLYRMKYIVTEERSSPSMSVVTNQD